jgi:hypothetical protein
MTYWIIRNLGTISLLESMTEEGVIIVDVRDLKDDETDKFKIRKKIELIAGLMSLGHRVAVRCVGGMNRSNCMAIATLCYIEPHGDLDNTWNFHYDRVKAVCGRAHICPDLVDTTKKVLKAIRRDWE